MALVCISALWQSASRVCLKHCRDGLKTSALACKFNTLLLSIKYSLEINHFKVTILYIFHVQCNFSPLKIQMKG